MTSQITYSSHSWLLAYHFHIAKFVTKNMADTRLSMRVASTNKFSGLQSEDWEKWLARLATRFRGLDDVKLAEALVGWASGNICAADVHSLLSRLREYDHYGALVGSTLRLWADAGRQWEATKAFELDRLLQGCAVAYGLRMARYVGRLFSMMEKKRHAVSS